MEIYPFDCCLGLVWFPGSITLMHLHLCAMLQSQFLWFYLKIRVTFNRWEEKDMLFLTILTSSVVKNTPSSQQ